MEKVSNASNSDDAEYLNGHFLVAMPGMLDPRFAHSVIYLCVHNAEGAMGLVINRPIEEMSFASLVKQLQIELTRRPPDVSIFAGGPVEAERGFVLHSTEYSHESTILINDHVALTATIDIHKDIATGKGPESRLIILGYSGWGPHQLDSEIKKNGWLHVEGDPDLLFAESAGEKWQRAMNKIGVDPLKLSGDWGHA